MVISRFMALLLALGLLQSSVFLASAQERLSDYEQLQRNADLVEQGQRQTQLDTFGYTYDIYGRKVNRDGLTEDEWARMQSDDALADEFGSPTDTLNLDNLTPAGIRRFNTRTQRALQALFGQLIQAQHTASQAITSCNQNQFQSAIERMGQLGEEFDARGAHLESRLGIMSRKAGELSEQREIARHPYPGLRDPDATKSERRLAIAEQFLDPLDMMLGTEYFAPTDEQIQVKQARVQAIESQMALLDQWQVKLREFVSFIDFLTSVARNNQQGLENSFQTDACEQCGSSH